ncbi:DUF1648 domain-containing protein [Spirosoma sp. KNUC1025]|uniref:DUF1648 domain-containing protein n=1 Tax=Spirosoma sp. KNUC1025 TaxID=2894082 RepID=UPI003865F465|nr:DUF1648 domain-containing protein [Spirosoma sp. KNUC1025]
MHTSQVALLVLYTPEYMDMSSYERNANRLTVILLVGLTLLSLAGAIWLPTPIAIHYNLSGQPDRWGNPATLLILPLVAFFIAGITWASEKLPPDFMNFPGPRTAENVARQLSNIHLMTASIRPLMVALFLLIQAESIWAKFYNHDRLVSWTIPVMATFITVVIGYFVWRAYRLVPRQ